MRRIAASAATSSTLSPGQDLLAEIDQEVADIGGKHHRAGVGQLDQQRLVAGRMAARVEDVDAGHERRVAVDDVPVETGKREVGREEGGARRAAEAVVVLAALDGEARLRHVLDVAGVVGVEVAEDDVADVAEADADLVRAAVRARARA